MIRSLSRLLAGHLLLLMALTPGLVRAQDAGPAVPLDEITNGAPQPAATPATVTATVKKATPQAAESDAMGQGAARQDAITEPANDQTDQVDQNGGNVDSFYKGPQSPADQESVDALMESTSPRSPQAKATQKLPMPQAISDDAEPWNRSASVVNDQLMMWLVRPLEKGYMAIAPEPARQHIRKMGNNLDYPKHLLNCLLQGKFLGATVETGRFLVNTTVGVLGLYDPASKMGMKPYPADFGQTLATWGWQPSSYFVIPFLGPSSGRDTVAKPLDWLVSVPIVGYFFMFNNYSFLLPSYQRLRASERDPYVLVRDLWAINREKEVQDYQISDKGKGDHAQTLDAIFLDVKDHQFLAKSHEFKSRMPKTGKKLPYNVWLQDHRAPLVFFLPGVGSHRISESTLAMAEMIYEHGCSVVTVSNALNWEFMESASRAAVPGYTPVDASDVYAALNAIYLDLKDRYPYQFTSTALMGLSLGALHTLFISGLEMDNQQSELHFDRYVAINPPVDLLYSLSQLDAYFNAPMQWPASVRDQKIKDTLLKAVKMSEGDLTPSMALPFDYVESQFLIGLNFRFILRDIIYSSQTRNNQHVLKNDYTWFARQPLYEEIYQYNYVDYMNNFVVPYYLKQSERGTTREQLLKESNLWSIERELKQNPKVRVYTNTNDFILRERDIDWLHKVLGDQRLSVFTEGGHLGNLHQPRVQDNIMKSLIDLKRP